MIDAACVACQGPLRASAWTRIATGYLHQCIACGSLTGVPRPGTAAQAALHDQDEYFDHPYFTLRRDAALADRRCREIFNRLASVVPANRFRGARHLDIGCDTGAMLDAVARAHGTVPFGVDVSRKSTAAANARGIAAFCGPVEALPADAGTFALVTAIDLIEHVPDPSALLREVGRRLTPEGVCYLETPNIASFVYTVGRWIGNATEGWPRGLHDRLFPPEHVQYFSRRGIRAVIERNGLRIVAMSTRHLPGRDLSVSPFVRIGLAGLQAVDRVMQQRILHWAVLSRASETARTSL